MITPQFWILLLAVTVGFVHVGGSTVVHGMARVQVHVFAVTPPPPKPRPHIKPKSAPPSIDCRKVRCLALTFDDGPNTVTTAQILHILEVEHVHATFFVVGSRVLANATLVHRMYLDGDEIGNHSWTHPPMTLLKPSQIRQQILLTQKAVQAAGAPAPTLFRPPYGAVDAVVRANIHMTFMFWNEDPRDWAANTPKEVESAVLAAARPGGVVDMHDIYHVTAQALDPTIKKLKAQHYHFVTVSELLAIKPGQHGDFFGRP